MPMTCFLFPFQASSFSSTLHFICFLQPCLVAVFFASCGLLVPTIPPTMTEWCHQVKTAPASRLSRLRVRPQRSWPRVRVSAGRYDDGPAPGRPRHRLQRLGSQILEEVRQVSRWISTTWVRSGRLEFWRARRRLILRFTTFVAFESCRACWEGKPLCGQSATIQCFFFPSHSSFVKLP